MRKLLADRKLTDVFADVGHAEIIPVETPGRGPDQQSGVILSYQTPAGQTARRMEFKEAEQRWTKIHDGLYIGVDPSDMPTAEDMRRKNQHGGYRVTLGNSEWLVPVIRRPDDSTLLPRDWYWDESGRDVQPIKEAYRAYWDETASVLDWFIADELPPEATSHRALELCVRALSINYRFGRNEQNVLRIIDPDNAMTILGITVDYPRFSELVGAVQQKKTRLTLSSGAGQTAASPITAPPAASC
jgi:hypothetical protein